MEAAMTRLQSEADAARTRVLLEQAFSPKVARQLETNPDILEGRDREVSVLFADLREFTSISERVGTRLTYELLTAVMDQFCAIIARHHGVIIDFYGDGVSAFWNAPLDQKNHAELACRCALAMVDSLPELNRAWQSRCGRPIEIGVGVDTGNALVGNAGCSDRLKYGPRGNCVNIASRLENATKQLGIPVLISESSLPTSGLRSLVLLCSVRRLVCSSSSLLRQQAF